MSVRQFYYYGHAGSGLLTIVVQAHFHFYGVLQVLTLYGRDDALNASVDIGLTLNGA